LIGFEGKCFQNSPASRSDCGHLIAELIPPNCEKSVIVPISGQS
jgi:hypothetical protein